QVRGRKRSQVDKAPVARVVPDAARIRRQLPRHGLQQRALARPGFSYDTQHFARMQVEADVAAAMHAVPGARQAAHGKQWLFASHAAASWRPEQYSVSEHT